MAALAASEATAQRKRAEEEARREAEASLPSLPEKLLDPAGVFHVLARPQKAERRPSRDMAADFEANAPSRLRRRNSAFESLSTKDRPGRMSVRVLEEKGSQKGLWSAKNRLRDLLTGNKAQAHKLSSTKSHGSPDDGWREKAEGMRTSRASRAGMGTRRSRTGPEGSGRAPRPPKRILSFLNDGYSDAPRSRPGKTASFEERLSAKGGRCSFLSGETTLPGPVNFPSPDARFTVASPVSSPRADGMRPPRPLSAMLPADEDKERTLQAQRQQRLDASRARLEQIKERWAAKGHRVSDLDQAAAALERDSSPRSASPRTMTSPRALAPAPAPPAVAVPSCGTSPRASSQGSPRAGVLSPMSSSRASASACPLPRGSPGTSPRPAVHI